MRPKILFPLFSDISNLAGVGTKIRKLLKRITGDRVIDILFTMFFAGNMESAVRSVKNAIKQWERKTCLRFVPRTNEKAYLEFFKDQG